MKNNTRLTYQASQEFEALVERIMTDVNVKNRKRFFNELFFGKTFNLETTKPKKINNQALLFNRNKTQIRMINNFFMSNVSEVKIDTNNSFIANDFPTSESLIEHMHIVDSEKGRPQTQYTANSEYGLTIYSPQFYDCYTRILEEALTLFDMQIATPRVNPLDITGEYYNTLQKQISSIVDLNKKGKTNAELEIKQRFILIADEHIEAVNNMIDTFSGVDEDKVLEQQHKNKEIMEVLLKATSDLDKVKTNRKASKECVAKIHLMINDLNKSIGTNKFGIDFVISRLKQIKLCAYSYPQSTSHIIEPFIQNLQKLNNAVGKFHDVENDEKATLKDKYRAAGIVKNTLRQVAMNNYNLVKNKDSK